MPEARLRARTWRDRVESRLADALHASTGTPGKLKQAMQYSVLAGGKRIRPMLVYAACDALDMDHGQLDAVACAVEIIHTYSLIHDDLPSMDNDDLRRGQPTCHKAFDVATAILAGDALQALAFEILAGDATLRQHPERQAHIIHTIASACGPAGMAGGQVLDLAAVGQELNLAQLTQVHLLKTGALFQASSVAPALFAAAGQHLHRRLETFGHCMGLAFQIQDDILDVTGTQEQTGKLTHKDARQHKPTFPALLGMDGARREALRLRDEALSALDGFPGDCAMLAYLAAVAVERDS
jgi:farnesyl diphosphate synthase